MHAGIVDDVRGGLSRGTTNATPKGDHAGVVDDVDVDVDADVDRLAWGD